MERYLEQKKCRFVHLSQVFLLLQLQLICLDFNQCHGLQVDFTRDQGREKLSSPVANTSDRHSRQLYLPVVLWSPPLRFLAPSSYSAKNGNFYPPHLKNFVPLYYQPSVQYPIQSANDISPAAESNVPSNENYPYQLLQLQMHNFFHANDFPNVHGSRNQNKIKGKQISCKTRNNQVGTCKTFSDCFPMMEMEFGNETNMDFPLAQQFLFNTKEATCSERNKYGKSFNCKVNGRRQDQKQQICCPSQMAGFIPGRNMAENENYYDDDYSVYFPPITQRPPLRIIMSRQLIERKMCGQSKLLGFSNRNRVAKALAHKGELKITGGQEARGPEEFPWMAGLFGKNQKLFCGASLISEQFLLSAAHCFATLSPSDIPHLYVHLGDFNIRTTSDGPHEVRKIDKLIIHKKFNIKNYHNDIALVKLDRPVNFTDRIRPICLPEPTMNSLENQKVIVTGWGRKYRHGTLSDVLRKVEMPIWNHDECKRVYSIFAPGRVLDNNLCAGDGRRNKDACIGDSGGPCQHFDGEKWVQLGITSWGKGCGSFPGIYTRTDKHMKWITQHLNQFSS